jgi:hypothetical protein
VNDQQSGIEAKLLLVRFGVLLSFQEKSFTAFSHSGSSVERFCCTVLPEHCNSATFLLL